MVSNGDEKYVHFEKWEGRYKTSRFFRPTVRSLVTLPTKRFMKEHAFTKELWYEIPCNKCSTFYYFFAETFCNNFLFFKSFFSIPFLLFYKFIFLHFFIFSLISIFIPSSTFLTFNKSFYFGEYFRPNNPCTL